MECGYKSEEDVIKNLTSIFNLYNLDKKFLTDKVLKEAYKYWDVNICLYINDKIKLPEWLLKEVYYLAPIWMNVLNDTKPIINKLFSFKVDDNEKIKILNSIKKEYMLYGIFKYNNNLNNSNLINSDCKIHQLIPKCNNEVKKAYMEFKLEKK